MTQKKIIPTILTDSLEDLNRKLELVEPHFDTVQIDYVDGFFAEGLSCCEAPQIATIQTSLFLEVQLMMDSPDSKVGQWVKTGAERLVGHIEKMDSQKKFVQAVSKAGIEVGLGLNLETNLSELEPNLIRSLDVVLLMAHAPGVSGQKFNPTVLTKVKALRQKFPHLNIEVDGGITVENAAKILDAGANWLAIGQTIFATQEPKKTIGELKSLISQ